MNFLSISKSGLVLAILLALAGCSLVSISPYDGSADKAITKLHKQTAEFFAESATSSDELG